MLGSVETILRALNDAGVRYLVVGGVAVVLHGRLRVTAEPGLVVQLEPANVRHAIASLERLGFRPRAPVAASSFADAWIEHQGLTVLSLRSLAHPAFELDLFVSEPFDFSATFARAARVQLRTTDAMVLSLDDLIAMNRAIGRPQDLDDAAALEVIRDGSAKSDGDGFDRGWEGHDRRQARLGLELTPAERLEWLERTLADMRELLGRAVANRPPSSADPGR